MSEKPKYDPAAQYGDYGVIPGHNATPEQLAEMKEILTEQIAATAKELGTVWPEDMIAWGTLECAERDPETGEIVPITAVWWKTTPQKKEEEK